jgi:hypothetical protein
MELRAAKRLVLSCFVALWAYPSSAFAGPIAVWEGFVADVRSNSCYLDPWQGSPTSIRLGRVAFDNSAVQLQNAFRATASIDVVQASAIEEQSVYRTNNLGSPPNTAYQPAQYIGSASASDRGGFESSPFGIGVSPSGSGAGGYGPHGSYGQNNGFGGLNNGFGGLNNGFPFQGQGFSQGQGSSRGSNESGSAPPETTNPNSIASMMSPGGEGTPHGMGLDHGATNVSIATLTTLPTSPPSTGSGPNTFAGPHGHEAFLIRRHGAFGEGAIPLDSPVPLGSLPSPTPEPATLTVLLICLAALAVYVRRESRSPTECS